MRAGCRIAGGVALRDLPLLATCYRQVVTTRLPKQNLGLSTHEKRALLQHQFVGHVVTGHQLGHEVQSVDR